MKKILSITVIIILLIVICKMPGNYSENDYRSESQAQAHINISSKGVK